MEVYFKHFMDRFMLVRRAPMFSGQKDFDFKVFIESPIYTNKRYIFIGYGDRDSAQISCTLYNLSSWFCVKTVLIFEYLSRLTFPK